MPSLLDAVSIALDATLESVNNIPVPPIPTPLLYLSDTSHGGLDYERLVNKILGEIGKIEPKVPISSNLPNGEKSVLEQVLTVACKCIVQELMENAKIEIAIAPGASVLSTGANAGGPVISNGFTTNFVKGVGVIS